MSVEQKASLTFGDVLVRNTAYKKYLVAMSDNCRLVGVQYDPVSYGSPHVYHWEPRRGSEYSHDGLNQVCTPIFDVNHATIDDDPVMNKILRKPFIAMTILENIYHTRMREGTMNKLEGTNLHRFFNSPYFRSFHPAPRHS
jgi:hypothetical protein